MALILSILKTVINLKCMHVEFCEIVSTAVQKFGQFAEQKQILVHARPFKRQQCLCPICRKRCTRNGHKHGPESRWRAPDLNGVPVYICHRPQRVLCPEHGALNEYIPWADGDSRFTPDFNNEVAWLVCQMCKSAIAAFMGINWRTVGSCIKAAQGRGAGGAGFAAEKGPSQQAQTGTHHVS